VKTLFCLEPFWGADHDPHPAILQDVLFDATHFASMLTDSKAFKRLDADAGSNPKRSIGSLDKSRLLVIDVLKISGIILIVLQHEWTTHVFSWLDQLYFSVNLWGVWQFEFGTIGVFLFLFASGLSLTYSHPQLVSWTDLKNFYKKRLLRIYPAYWIGGIGFVLCMYPWLLNQTFDWLDIAKIASGFQAFGALTAADHYGKLNGTLWFIGVIVTMYIAFPILLYIIKKHPHISIAGLFAVSFLSRYYLANYSPYFLPTNWFPLCSVFEFGLGIYLVTVGLVPRIVSNGLTKYLSNISFYVFLINSPLLIRLQNQQEVFLVLLVILSTALWQFDEGLRIGIRHYVRWAKDHPWFVD
jgi:peptidoglycan/LPS O-acetylase OafA/YrhL